MKIASYAKKTVEYFSVRKKGNGKEEVIVLSVVQIRAGGFDNNFSYVIMENETKEGAVIDPCGDTQKIVDFLHRNEIKTRYIIDTHGHGDHISGNSSIKEETGAPILCHQADASGIHPDQTLADNTSLPLGNSGVKVIHTPGHTPGSICLLADNTLVTGDTLFVGYCGRTDIGGGNAEALYHSLYEKLSPLPDETKIYPGHDYGISPTSTLGEEKKNNPYLKCRNKEEFMLLRERGI